MYVLHTYLFFLDFLKKQILAINLRVQHKLIITRVFLNSLTLHFDSKFSTLTKNVT